MLDFLFDSIFSALDSFFDMIGEFIDWIIVGIITLAGCVVDYFKGLKLRKGKDIPFIAEKSKIAELIHNAPTKDVGIFEATYNEDTNEIENYRALQADEMDSKLKTVLGDEKLVVLT